MSEAAIVFERVVVAGVGLIGGSFAAALRAAGAARRLVGVGRSQAALSEALRLGLIDEVAPDWASALAGADLLLLAMPVGQMPAVMQAIKPHLNAQIVITDAGSTKADVAAAVYQYLPEFVAHFVPAHPIAGAEKSGPAAAFAALYQDKKVVLTPLPENTPAALAKVRGAWQLCGAKLFEMSPAAHDGVFAAVSHLPHVLAFALVNELASRHNAAQFFDFAASGFRDFTRIAGGHPEMWRDICLANQTALLTELDAYQAQLTQLRSALAAGDAQALDACFTAASQARQAWGAKQ